MEPPAKPPPASPSRQAQLDRDLVRRVLSAPAVAGLASDMRHSVTEADAALATLHEDALGWVADQARHLETALADLDQTTPGTLTHPIRGLLTDLLRDDRHGARPVGRGSERTPGSRRETRP